MVLSTKLGNYLVKNPDCHETIQTLRLGWHEGKTLINKQYKYKILDRHDSKLLVTQVMNLRMKEISQAIIELHS
jgi:hypothetical protein